MSNPQDALTVTEDGDDNFDVPNRVRRPAPSLLARFPELRRLFLKHLARYGNRAAAAKYCRISLTVVKDFENANPDFARQLEDAHAEHCARIEEAVYTRAIDGVEEPRFTSSGEVSGYVTKYSDQLLLAYARRHIKEYRQGDEAPGPSTRRSRTRSQQISTWTS